MTGNLTITNERLAQIKQIPSEPGLRQAIRRLAAEAAAWLRPGARLMCEFGDGQSPALTELFTRSGWQIVAVEPDLSGRARILVACHAES